MLKQVPKANTDATAIQASPYDSIYDVSAFDSDGTAVSSADIIRIVITLPLDLTVVQAGDLERGLVYIMHAPTQATLEAGSGARVAVSRIIQTDYVGDGFVGSVTFWVDSLSFFGIGSIGSGGSSGVSLVNSEGSSCMIGTAADGFLGDSMMLGTIAGSAVLVLIVAMLGAVRRRRRKRP